MNLTVKYQLIPSEKGFTVDVPRHATGGSAGLDLQACMDEPVELRPGEINIIPSGIAAQLPEGYAGFLFARSGLGIKHGITMANSVGVIDSDYRGEIRMGLINLSNETYIVNPGDRVAQLVIMPVTRAEFVPGSIGGTERGSGGFGSTGR
jgi:dUTP pyrophosphatase